MATNRMEMHRFKLVIFDCDGVLVDSEHITSGVFRTMLGELGLSLSPEQMFDAFAGRSMAQCMDGASELLGGALPDAFERDFTQRADAALRAHIRPIEGVADMLQKLRVPYCVASSGRREKIRLTLGATGLLEHFEGRIFSVFDVAKPKPEPDIFLLAARTFGIVPASCAVIEDTPTGVSAGVAAGMHVFGFAATTPPHALTEAGAHEVFSAMHQLPALLQ